jgi:plasmid rolling circle replication initiator protein Rep
VPDPSREKLKKTAVKYKKYYRVSKILLQLAAGCQETTIFPARDDNFLTWLKSDSPL